MIDVMFFSAPRWLGHIVLALQQEGVTDTTQTPAATPSWAVPVFLIGGIMMLFYFVILKPQKTERKKTEDMMGAMAKGDEVVTIGGIHGKIESIDSNKNVLSIGIGPKSSIRIDRWAIKSVIPKGKRKKNAEESKS